MLAHERLELGNDFSVSAEREIRVDPRLRAGESKLLEPRDLRLRESLEPNVCERGPAPEPQRPAQGVGGVCRVAARELAPASRR